MLMVVNRQLHLDGVHQNIVSDT